MNILGCILFTFAGILAIKFPGFAKETDTRNYSNCCTAMGRVSHVHDFGGDRWLVYFMDAMGKEVMGLDDIIAASSFSKKYKSPTFGSDERIYYYPISENVSYSINGEKILYYIHFCNEDLYERKRHEEKRSSVIGLLLGIVFIICALLILIFG